jgi:hypothetical protein
MGRRQFTDGLTGSKKKRLGVCSSSYNPSNAIAILARTMKKIIPTIIPIAMKAIICIVWYGTNGICPSFIFFAVV